MKSRIVECPIERAYFISHLSKEVKEKVGYYDDPFLKDYNIVEIEINSEIKQFLIKKMKIEFTTPIIPYDSTTDDRIRFNNVILGMPYEKEKSH